MLAVRLGERETHRSKEQMMPYDDDFFERYAAYQQEEIVARVHQRMIDFAKLACPNAFDAIVDLGCGACELLVRAQPSHYLGIDAQPRRPSEELTDRDYKDVGIDYRIGLRRTPVTAIRENYGLAIPLLKEWFVTADYRKMDFGDLAKVYTSFGSLFSSAITTWNGPNLFLYERIFEQAPMIQAGLIAGFYYSDRKTAMKVKEAGGVESYQITERPDTFQSNLFTVTEIVTHVPSSFFGPKVWEVWRLLERRRG